MCLQGNRQYLRSTLRQSLQQTRLYSNRDSLSAIQKQYRPMCGARPSHFSCYSCQELQDLELTQVQFFLLHPELEPLFCKQLTHIWLHPKEHTFQFYPYTCYHLTQYVTSISVWIYPHNDLLRLFLVQY